MKIAFRIFGVLSVMFSLLACIILILAFKSDIDLFTSKWNYWILELLLFILIPLSLTFGVLLFRPNLSLTNKLLWTTVIVLILIIFLSSDSKAEAMGIEANSLVIMTGIPVILSGLFSLFIVKKEHSGFYSQFQSKLNGYDNN